MIRIRFILALAFVCASSTTRAQLPQVVDSRLGVDSVKIEHGQRLYGFVLSQRPDRSIVFAVERQWLEKTYPQLSTELILQEKERADKSQQQRIERIEVWLKQRLQDRALTAFLERELERFNTARLNQETTKQFVSVELSAARYRELFVQPPDRRKIAGLAFQNSIDSVTTTPVNSLQKQLVALGVDLAVEQVNLAGGVEASPDTDRQWAARKAVVEHLLRKPLEYQGSGNAMIRKSDTPDISAVFAQLMSSAQDPISQLGAELGLPEFKQPKESADQWRKRPIEEAERDRFCGVMITRLSQNALSPTVTVTAHFFAMEKPGTWFEVTRITSAASTAEQTANRLQRIQDDPQIKSVIDTLKSLGLGDQSLLEQALRHGAATQQALENANGKMNAFLSTNSRELDSQPIELTP